MNYLSPTGISKFIGSKEDFYLKYVLKVKDEPQTKAMAAGGAFDACVKGLLSNIFFGTNEVEYRRAAIEENIEPQNREDAEEIGMELLAAYRSSGALADLLIELRRATGIKMESTVRATVGGIPFLGKPDLSFISRDGAQVIYDWKVNNFYSKNAVSPKKGYVTCRDSWKSSKQSRNNGGSHKDAILEPYKGLVYNTFHTLNDINPDWGRQLCIYAWCMGFKVGGEFLVGIDQLVGRPPRVASFRSLVNTTFQTDLLSLAQEIWRKVEEDDFPELDLPRLREVAHAYNSVPDLSRAR